MTGAHLLLACRWIADRPPHYGQADVYPIILAHTRCAKGGARQNRVMRNLSRLRPTSERR